MPFKTTGRHAENAAESLLVNKVRPPITPLSKAGKDCTIGHGGGNEVAIIARGLEKASLHRIGDLLSQPGLRALPRAVLTTNHQNWIRAIWEDRAQAPCDEQNKGFIVEMAE
jgi:hypothetical protein